MSKNKTDKMLTAVADFLKSEGWNVVVIGSPRIQQQPGDAKFNYEFVVRFTGAPPKQSSAPTLSEGKE